MYISIQTHFRAFLNYVGCVCKEFREVWKIFYSYPMEFKSGAHRGNRVTESQKLHYLVGIIKKTWQASRNTNDPQDMYISHIRQTPVLLLVLVNTFRTITDPMLAYSATCWWVHLQGVKSYCSLLCKWTWLFKNWKCDSSGQVIGWIAVLRTLISLTQMSNWCCVNNGILNNCKPIESRVYYMMHWLIIIVRFFRWKPFHDG